MSESVPVAIQVEELTKVFADLVAVDRLSFEVPAGRLFGFLGPNGAGKSTTIGCLTGLIDASEGTIRLLGEPLTESGTRKKRLADFRTGMRKKVAFAAAIIHRPEILFLDEPFESIDPAGVAMLKDWLRRYVAGGRTVFMTSHVLETVERLCDDVAIIDKGRMAWRGEVAHLASGGRVAYDGHEFSTLESLFLHLVGERGGQLTWL